MVSPSLPSTEDRLPGDYIHAVRFIPVKDRPQVDGEAQVTVCGFVIPDDWPPQKGLINCSVCRHELAKRTEQDLGRGVPDDVR
jgi:hypothetical protein